MNSTSERRGKGTSSTNCPAGNTPGPTCHFCSWYLQVTRLRIRVSADRTIYGKTTTVSWQPKFFIMTKRPEPGFE